MFWFFGPEVCRLLASQPGVKPTPPELEGDVLTTGPSGKSLLGDSDIANHWPIIPSSVNH